MPVSLALVSSRYLTAGNNGPGAEVDRTAAGFCDVAHDAPH